jgi:hypothetical protein
MLDDRQQNHLPETLQCMTEERLQELNDKIEQGETDHLELSA